MKINACSVTPDSTKLIALRRQLGWTQLDAATKAGYSDRLIRKIEKPLPVRPQTLRDVVQCYLNALGEDVINIEKFFYSPHQSSEPEASQDQTQVCPFASRVREYYEVIYHQRNLDQVEEFACKQIRFISEGVTRAGSDAIRQRASALLAAFDPIKFSIERSFTWNQIVVSYWSVRMRHVGPFFQIPATNRWVNVRGNSLIKFAESLAVEAEEQFNVDDLLRQLTGRQPRTI